MELDDLKQAWQDLDRKLERQHAMDLLRFREERGKRLKSGLWPLVLGQGLQMLIGLAVLLLGVDFWTSHRDVTHLFVCGLILHVYGVALIACGGMVQAMIAAVDYSAPVLEIQKRLARLRKFYVRTGMVVGLAWWLIWMPFMTVVFMVLFGADLYLNAPSVFVIGGAIGVVGLLATWWFHHWSRHPSRPRLAKAMEDSITGRSLRRAQAIAEEIARFERD
ncbi:hypothetical protein [Lysobacter sp. cf310]|uniref:hypothetical protein n=1 Tax=Lysobacter sp. cf310 TaxID=1761790 RepID=UPI0008E48C87|nr:hypothetical protein [Lysobacter sp. cf310]SFK82301.1 serine/threonine protein kinase [Lysobacter sp. cf310]